MSLSPREDMVRWHEVGSQQTLNMSGPPELWETTVCCKPPSLWFLGQGLRGLRTAAIIQYSAAFTTFFLLTTSKDHMESWLPAPFTFPEQSFPPYLGAPCSFFLWGTVLSPQMSAKDDSWQSLLSQILAFPLCLGHCPSARWAMKLKPVNEAGISWLGGRGQLRPEKLSGNIGHILVLTSKAYLHPAQWLAHTVSLYELENCAPLRKTVAKRLRPRDDAAKCWSEPAWISAPTHPCSLDRSNLCLWCILGEWWPLGLG